MELSASARVVLFVLLAVMGVYSVLVLFWQIHVLRGEAMQNVDGSADDWHEQKTHFGIAVADIFVACPANLIAIAFIFLAPRWGYYLLAMVSFWWVWANVMTTATSLRFESPRITVSWLLIFPAGILVGLAYIVWTLVHFETIYLS